MDRHGRARWADIEAKLSHGTTCPKLQSYWHYHGCRYDKISRTCAEPDHIGGCPVPSHDLRNGRLNQTAYSLYLFIRDIAGGAPGEWIYERQTGWLKGRKAFVQVRGVIGDAGAKIIGVNESKAISDRSGKQSTAGKARRGCRTRSLLDHTDARDLCRAGRSTA